MFIQDKSRFIYDDGTIRVWVARICDYNYALNLCKRYRDHEFFFVPDATLKHEIRKGNILMFDYNVFEAGYIWVTFPKNGRSRINQLAVDEELWRKKVGTVVTDVYEGLADRYGMWCVYLSCNTETPGDRFWPKVGWENICSKPAGSRGGLNIIWAKLLPRSKTDLLFSPNVFDIKSVDSYVFQSSITEAVKNKKNEISQDDLFDMNKKLK